MYAEPRTSPAGCLCFTYFPEGTINLFISQPEPTLQSVKMLESPLADEKTKSSSFSDDLDHLNEDALFHHR